MARSTEAESEPEPEAGPIDRDERLGEAIEAYLGRAEAGHPPNLEAFAAGYPDLGEDLVAALEGLALVRGLVGDAGGLGHRLEEGRRVAGYRIVRELGRGGMGIVYEAVHVGLDRPVALKVLGSSAAPDSSGRRRFLNEARTAAGLHHTHIVPVFDVGQVGGLCYYAMQRIEGSGLDRVLRHLRRDRVVAAGSASGPGSPRTAPAASTRPLPGPSPDAALAASGLGDETLTWAGGAPPAWGRMEPDDEPPAFLPPRGSAYYRWVADVGRQAAEALGFAHQRGVIHRDIKPSNLLVDGRGTIWVADFGLARRLADPSQTQVDSLLGTPRYMSPEQARTGAIDGRADVYSLGATLYELLTLRPPFDGQTAAELVEQIAHREPARPRKFDSRAPLDLETILLKALAKRPGDRYATAEDLAEDLARFLAHEPVRARRIGPVGRLWRFARRHPGLTAVSTTAAAVVLTTATIAYVRVVAERDQAIHARSDARQAEARTREALRQAESARLVGLEKHATAVLLSSAANRRSVGLDLLTDAAKLGPDPAMRVKLRDQALSFLTIRDVEARPPIAAARPHGLAFGDAGRRIAALTDDNELAIWSVEGGTPGDSARLPSGPPRGRGPAGQPKDRRFGGPFGAARIASAGAQVAVARPDGAGLRLFDVTLPGSPAEDLPMKGHDVASIAASAEGRTLATLERPARPEADEARITLWDRLRPDAPRATLVLPAPAPRADALPFGGWRLPLLAISPDGSTVAAVRPGESEVALWEGDGTPLEPIDVQANATALALGPAGQLAVAGGGEIVIWDLAQRKPLPGLGRRQGFVRQLRFSPLDGSLLAASTDPGGIELWDVAAHALVAALPTRDRVDDLAFSPDGRTLAASQSTSIALWSIVEPVAQAQLPESTEVPVALAFGPGDLLAIASRDAARMVGPLRLWARPGSSPPDVRRWDRARPAAVGFDDRGRVATLEARGLRWYLPADPTPVAEADAPEPHRGARPTGRGDGPPPGPPPPSFGRGSDRGLARSRDGLTLAFARAGDILIWRAGNPEAITRFDIRDAEAPTPGPGRNNALFVALSPDASRLFVYAAAGERLSTYTLTGRQVPRLGWGAPFRDVTALAVGPDGSTLAVGDRSGGFTLVDVVREVVQPRLAPPADDTPASVASLAFAPDGSTLAVGTRDQVRLWSVRGDPRPLVRLPGHRGTLSALAFDVGGTRLAGADEKTVKVWDLARLRAELDRHGLGW